MRSSRPVNRPTPAGTHRSVLALALLVALASPMSGQHAVRTAGSAFTAAAANARLANEAFVRSDRLMMDWLTLADSITGLLPRNTTNDRDIWNAKDCAADLYPFLVLTAWYTRPELYAGRMQEMLLTETALTSRIGRLPDTYSFSRRGFAESKIDTAAIMFGGSEYVKDALMPITELLGARRGARACWASSTTCGGMRRSTRATGGSCRWIPRSMATCRSCWRD